MRFDAGLKSAHVWCDASQTSARTPSVDLERTRCTQRCSWWLRIASQLQIHGEFDDSLQSNLTLVDVPASASGSGLQVLT